MKSESTIWTRKKHWKLSMYNALYMIKKHHIGLVRAATVWLRYRFTLERVSWCNENRTQISVTLEMGAWEREIGRYFMYIDIHVSQYSNYFKESIKSFLIVIIRGLQLFTFEKREETLYIHKYGKRFRIWFKVIYLILHII